MKTHRGFTLIELLVVVAIITTLIAILLPSLGRAREHAQGVTCASNQRQLAVISIAWANENNLWLPPAVFYRMFDKYGAPWGSGVFTCPAANDYDPTVQHDVGGVLKTHYVIGINQNLVMSTDGPAGPYNGTEWESGSGGGAWGPNNVFFNTHANAKLNEVADPARSVLYTDTRQDHNGYVAGYWWNVDEGRRHTGRSAVAWIDGHASLSPDDWLNTLVPRAAGGGIPYFRTGTN